MLFDFNGNLWVHCFPLDNAVDPNKVLFESNIYVLYDDTSQYMPKNSPQFLKADCFKSTVLSKHLRRKAR